MFCTKCGKQVHKDNMFCAHCGNRILPIEENSQRRADDYANIIFNPPFKIEAERKTEQIKNDLKKYNVEVNNDPLNLPWNLDGFPTNESRPKVDADFEWGVFDNRNTAPKSIDIEKITPMKNHPEEREEVKTFEEEFSWDIGGTEREASKDDANFDLNLDTDHEAMMQQLERELFHSENGERDWEERTTQTQEYEVKSLADNTPQEQAESVKVAKKEYEDSFQRMLEEERKRVEELVAERKAQWDALSPQDDYRTRKPKEPATFEEMFSELDLMKGSFLRQVDMALPPSPICTMASEDGIKAYPAKPASNEKNKAAQRAQILDEVWASVQRAESGEKNRAGFVEAKGDTHRIQSQPESITQPERSVQPEQFVTENFGEIFGDSGAANTTKPNMASEERKSQPVDFWEAGESKDAKKKPLFNVRKNDSKKQENKNPSYSDIFPKDVFEFDKNSIAPKVNQSLNQEEPDDEQGIGYKVIRALLIIAAVFVVLELGIIGIKFFAPASPISVAVDGIILDIKEIFTKEKEVTQAVDQDYMAVYAKNYGGKASQIGTVQYNPDLKFEMLKTFAFEDVSRGVLYNSPDAVDETKVLSGLMVGAVVDYYAKWEQRNQGNSFEGVGTLEIGEIRKTDAGYYALNKIIYIAEGGGAFQVYETVYLASDGKTVTIVDVKEEIL